MRDYFRRLASTGAAYTASSVISKFFAVALLPIYTRHLTKSDYGAAEVLLPHDDALVVEAADERLEEAAAVRAEEVLRADADQVAERAPTLQMGGQMRWNGSAWVWQPVN